MLKNFYLLSVVLLISSCSCSTIHVVNMDIIYTTVAFHDIHKRE